MGDRRRIGRQTGRNRREPAEMIGRPADRIRLGIHLSIRDRHPLAVHEGPKD